MKPNQPLAQTLILSLTLTLKPSPTRTLTLNPINLKLCGLWLILLDLAAAINLFGAPLKQQAQAKNLRKENAKSDFMIETT